MKITRDAISLTQSQREALTRLPTGHLILEQTETETGGTHLYAYVSRPGPDVNRRREFHVAASTGRIVELGVRLGIARAEADHEDALRDSIHG